MPIGHVDEQHPLPAGVLGQDAAEQHARRATGAGDRAHTPSARLRSAPSANIVVTSDRAAGDMIAAPRPCSARAAMSKLSDCARPPTSEATANRTEPADEHAPAAEEVGEAPAEQQEAAEGERVGVDDPRQVVLVEVERAADRRQRHVHDRGVEDDHELRQGEQRQREPLGAAGGAAVMCRMLLTGDRGPVPFTIGKIRNRNSDYKVG